jgi:nucleoporin NUP60
MPRYNSQKSSLQQQQENSQQKQSHTTPYYVPPKSVSNKGLFSKIKGFFNNRQEEEKTKLDSKNNITNLKNDERNKRKPFNFDNVNVSTIDLSVHSNLSFASKNPNDTLSEFFNRKGNTPLNDVEIEGVMSLIRKAQTSRVSSRNNSIMINNNRNNNNSYLLNSHMDSKLGGLSSFNDINNTTILRSASSNLPQPVKIKTPTFISKSSNRLKANNNNNNNNNTSINISTMSNSSRSFLSHGNIRKKRIVSYSNLESPYKLKTASPLTAFLEKKKLLEKQLNEEKSTKLKSVIKENASDNKVTNTAEKSMVYKGGIIDLSNIDNDEDNNVSDDNHDKNTETFVQKKELSKTASKVLDILNFDNSVSTEKNTHNEIITIKDIPEEKKKQEKFVKPIISTSKPNLGKNINQPIVSKFSFQANISNDNREKKINNLKEQKPAFTFTPIKIEESKNSVSSLSKQESSLKPLTSTPFKFSIEVSKPEIKDQMDEKITIIDDNKDKDVAIENDVECIESFMFPEVLAPVINNTIHESTVTESAMKPVANGTIEFTFPTVSDAPTSAVNIKGDEYTDIFTF